MIFIYDIWINLNDDFYDFYEWSETDITEHVRKIPLIKINRKLLENLKNKNIIISKSFLNTIYNKCEIFNNKSVEIIEYLCVFSDGFESVVTSFNKEGKVLELSSTIINEEIEILDIADTLIEKDIKYKELNRKCEKKCFTRNELRIVNSIISELEKIKKDVAKIEYLYYEWFGNTKDFSYTKLEKSIKKEFNSKHLEFVEILKLVV